MTVIKRGIGLTPTEKNLTALADKIFLNLWAYRISSRTTAKRCATCSWSAGDDVLIFSDKEITWQKGDNFDLSWSRWYRGAIEESAKQINGAARYLRDHYDQLFLDAACTEKFPLILPPLDRRRVHHIAVALGASEACADYYKKVPGYFPIAPDLRRRTFPTRSNAGVPWGAVRLQVMPARSARPAAGCLADSLPASASGPPTGRHRATAGGRLAVRARCRTI